MESTTSTTSETFDVIAFLNQWANDCSGMSFIMLALMVTLILVGTFLVSRFFVKLLERVLSHDDSPLAPSSILITLVRAAVWCLGLCILLSVCFRVDVSAIIAALGVTGIALSLGLQDTISNIIGGLQLSVMRIIQPGDHVLIGSTEGVVRDVKWRHTTIDGFSGEYVVIPNSNLNNNSLTVLPPIQKLRVDAKLPYDVVMKYQSEGKTVSDVATMMCTSVKEALERPAPEGPGLTISQNPVLNFSSMGEMAYFGKLVVWVENENLNVVSANDVIIRALAAFGTGDVSNLS